MDDIDIRLLLLQVPGLGNSLVKKILKEYGILLKDRDFLIYFFRKKYLLNFFDIMDNIKIIKENCCFLGVDIVLNRNLNIPDYPLILFLKGNRNLLDSNKIIAIAGTRFPTKVGKAICSDFTQVAVDNNVVLVTGFAIGCDRICYNLHIKNERRSIAVLPYGYNKNLDIFANNDRTLFLSEYPPYLSVKKYMFIKRNRIIVGISRSLFIPEVKSSGGSYHTIKYAEDMGIPIAYGSGNLDRNRCNLNKLKNPYEFDLFIKKSLK